MLFEEEELEDVQEVRNPDDDCIQSGGLFSTTKDTPKRPSKSRKRTRQADAGTNRAVQASLDTTSSETSTSSTSGQ